MMPMEASNTRKRVPHTSRVTDLNEHINGNTNNNIEKTVNGSNKLANGNNGHLQSANGKNRHLKSANGDNGHLKAANGKNGTVNGKSQQTDINQRQVIGIDGKWYDITDFVSRHPGGPVIEHFIGHDATNVFHAQGHPKGLLKHRKPVGTYDVQPRHPADAEFDQLRDYFLQNDFFITDFVWYTKKVLFALAMLLCAIGCVVKCDEWYMHYLGALFLAGFWQQCGFFMHDFMHGQVFRHHFLDRLGGVMTGTIGFGISSHWWQDEHRVHHALTNTVDAAKQFADPQMWEAVWAQNKALFPLFKNMIQPLLIKIQHFTFVPVVCGIGRFGILIDSYVTERRWYELVAIGLHWAWTGALMSYLPTWRDIITFYLIASWLQGFLHLQLIMSHYCKDFLTIDKYHKHSWYVFQITSNLNIDTSWWQDWFYGGLNFHIEHHLYPKMSRNKLREASRHIKEICDKHDIPYEANTFPSALWRTLKHLKQTSLHYTLDPR